MVKMAAAELATPQVPLTTNLYLEVFCEAIVLLKIKVAEVAPPIFVNTVPPSVLTCH